MPAGFTLVSNQCRYQEQIGRDTGHHIACATHKMSLHVGGLPPKIGKDVCVISTHAKCVTSAVKGMKGRVKGLRKDSSHPLRWSSSTTLNFELGKSRCNSRSASQVAPHESTSRRLTALPNQMSCNHTDERLLRHLRHKHSKVGLSPTDQFVVEPRRASVKPR